MSIPFASFQIYFSNSLVCNDNSNIRKEAIFKKQVNIRLYLTKFNQSAFSSCQQASSSQVFTYQSKSSLSYSFWLFGLFALMLKLQVYKSLIGTHFFYLSITAVHFEKILFH